MIAETLIVHGGDLIEWRLASGFINKPPARIAPAALIVEFTKAPRALRVFHKANGTVVWHKDSAGPTLIVDGQASEEQLKPHPTTTHPIEGRVSDPAGRYLPRTFAFTLGNAAEHKIALFHSPLGAQFSKAGGIYGRIAFNTGAVAPWALIGLTVTPSLGAPLKFVAQCDRHGEFRLPLDRLPALTKDAPSPTYEAKLEIRALAAANPETPLDPATLVPMKVAKSKTGNGNSTFANTLNLAIAPGAIARVISPQHDVIVIKP